MPVLVLVDVQKEYIARGRPFFLKTIEPSLNNLRKLLAHARAQNWKIIHIRHEQNAECFSYGSEYAQPIEGFEPLEGESSFIKSNFSCFSNREFQSLMDKWRHEDIILAGYGATMCCLSTMIDAHHRGHEFTFVKDATCARRSERFDEQDIKERVIDLIGAFGKIAETCDILKMEKGIQDFLN